MPLFSVGEFIERFQSKSKAGFHAISDFVGERPWTVIICTVSITLLLGSGIFPLREVNNVRDHFGSENAPSRYEFNVAREFFRELGGLFHLIVAMEASDGGNLLRPGYIDKAMELEEYLQFGLRVEFQDRQWAYSDFCGTQCENSDAVQVFLALFQQQQQKQSQQQKQGQQKQQQLSNNLGDQIGKSRAVKLTFPSVDVFGNRIYLGNNFFRIRLNNRSSILESANLIVLYFPAIYPNASMEAVMKRWEQAVWQFALQQNRANNPLIRLCLTSEGLVSEEVRQTGAEAEPLMPLSILVVALFTALTARKADHVASKSGAALLGLLCPLFSIVASFGLLLWLGLEFLPILIVVPFLVLAVGVDDVFIMLHCWAQTERKLALEDRLREMLAQAGPSMGITSLTNWLSFTIGIWTPVPAIRIFCIFTSTAVFFAYIFQLFFYTAIMAISGRREDAQLLRQCKTGMSVGQKQPKSDGWDTTSKPAASVGTNTSKRIADPPANGLGLLSFLFNAYLRFLTSRVAKFLLGVGLLFYWALAGWGLGQLRVGLTTEKLFHQDSLMLALYKLQTEVIFREGGQMAIFVNSPGDLRSPGAVADLMNAVALFEQAPGSVGATSTHMWLNAYMPFLGLQGNGTLMRFSYKFVPDFLALPEYRRWSHFMNVGTKEDCLNERPECVHKFFLTTSFRGAVSWPEKLETVTHWRRLAARYAHFNLSVYENDSIYADQLLTIPPVTIQTVSLALVCMGAVLALFTPSLPIVLTGSLAVLSINLGVFGFLHFWDIDLDPISMMTTLMAIGLSVDFVAHISFHYYKANRRLLEREGRRERLRHALESIAWPMLQAGLSTLLCVSVLALIRVYMVQVFVKVVALVVLLGLVHGLLVLPIVYSAIPSSNGISLGGQNSSSGNKQQFMKSSEEKGEGNQIGQKKKILARNNVKLVGYQSKE